MNNSNGNVLSERVNKTKYQIRQDKIRRSSRYNYTDMKDEVLKMHKDFAKRLNVLRMSKNVSAREMSLSLGQGAGYINNIENGYNLPSMAMLFEICEYLDVTPKEFFEYTDNETEICQFINSYKKLDEEEQSIISTLIKRLLKHH